MSGYEPGDLFLCYIMEQRDYPIRRICTLGALAPMACNAVMVVLHVVLVTHVTRGVCVHNSNGTFISSIHGALHQLLIYASDMICNALKKFL